MSTLKFNIGDVFIREGKCRLYICGFHHNGTYLLWKLLRAVNDFHINITPSRLSHGSVVILPGGRKRFLIKQRDTGYWDWTNPDDITEMTEDELEMLQADDVVRNMPHQIARMNHPERQSRAAKYLPVKTD